MLVMVLSNLFEPFLAAFLASSSLNPEAMSSVTGSWRA